MLSWNFNVARHLILGVLPFLALSACESKSDSETLDNKWAASSTQHYAAVRQSSTAGYYNIYFFSADTVTGVKVCFASALYCQANDKDNYAMTSSKTSDGKPAFLSPMLAELQENSLLTFTVSGQGAAETFKIQKSANGELDPVALNPGQTPPAVSTPISASPSPKPTPKPVEADPLVPNPQGLALSSVEASIVRESNRARQLNGLSILPVRSDLMGVARQTAQRNATYNMANAHSGANTYENVYYAMPDARSAVFGSSMGPGWLDHPGHRENLLNSSVTAIGASMAVSPSTGTPHWVEDFL